MSEPRSPQGASTEPVPEVQAGPPSSCFAEIRRFSQIDSTNRYLVDVARRIDTSGPASNSEFEMDAGRTALVAVAAHQTAGRGRLGRRWEAPAGANLLVSLLLRPDLPLDQAHLCTALLALSAAEACREASWLEPELKWPNDLMVGHRKLAGILAESVPDPAGPGRPRAVVVGLGLNLAWPPTDADGDGDEMPEDLRNMATSIVRETGVIVSPDQALMLLLRAADRRLRQLADVHGRLEVAAEYRARCATVGRSVRVVRADDEIHGVATDITPEGHLVVDQGACFTTVTAGDVVHVFPEG